MKLSRLLAILIVASTAAAAHAADDKPAGMKLLGAWVVDSAEEGGVDTERPVGDRVQFKQGEIVVTPQDGKEQKAKYKVDTSKTPHTIDIDFEQGGAKLTIKGLYAFKDGKLRLCMSPPKQDRPKSLTSEKETQQISMTLSRVKEGDK